MDSYQYENIKDRLDVIIQLLAKQQEDKDKIGTTNKSATTLSAV